METNLATFVEKSYLNYSMYVILDRALPNIADGLKPVQRRIIYAMSELKLSHNAKYKKSARTIGDVLGKFHPHGDQACYEAMVHIAQPFSYRYPLVDGQGNWGSIDDPKSFAAMRYTEAKLADYSQILLSEINKDTIEWQDNFDGSLKEPKLLPARLPNLLLNGASGIAVGMATDFLPHNLIEVANACIYLLKNKNADIAEICKHIQAPDFPTKANIISSKEQIMDAYKTGIGSIRARALYKLEKNNIVIYALPYQSSGEKIIKQIAKQMQDKKLSMISDIRDESDHSDPIRIVIFLKSSRINIESIMLHLFASTDLEKQYRINMNVIGLNGKPQVKSLMVLLREWLDFRREIVYKRLANRLSKVESRLHILDGLIIAHLNIDEVINIIRTEDKPKLILIERFKLTEQQAETILEIKLRQLAKLEEIQLRTEQKNLITETKKLNKLLNSENELTKLLINEISEDRDKFGDDRRSKITVAEPAKLLEQNMIISDPITIILSEKGWIRAGKGHNINGKDLNYKTGDHFLTQINAKTDDIIVCIANDGRVYNLLANLLPSARGQGEPLTNHFNLSANKFIKYIFSEKNTQEKYVLVNDKSYGFCVKFEDLYVKNKSGKIVFNLSEQANILTPQKIDDFDKNLLAIITKNGRLLIIHVNELPILSKGKGNKLINLEKDDVVTNILVFQHKFKLFAGKRHININYSDYLGKRAQKGKILPKGFQKVDTLCKLS